MKAFAKRAPDRAAYAGKHKDLKSHGAAVTTQPLNYQSAVSLRPQSKSDNILLSENFYRPGVTTDSIGLQRKPQNVPENENLNQPTDSVQRSPRFISTLSGNVLQREFVGDQARHHMHVGAGVHQPHYKNGNDRRSRINIGNNQDYRKADMEAVIEAIKGRANEPGAQECIDWCKRECRAIIEGAGGRTALRR